MKTVPIILLFFFALCIMPNEAKACDNGKKFCKKEMSDSETKKNCCGTGDHSKNDHSGCNGKCGHSSCVNPIVSFAGAVPPTITINVHKGEASSTEKQQFFYRQPRLTSGYYTIWLIPKISFS